MSASHNFPHSLRWLASPKGRLEGELPFKGGVRKRPRMTVAKLVWLRFPADWGALRSDAVCTVRARQTGPNSAWSLKGD
jgi:hypothetical protein